MTAKHMKYLPGTGLFKHGKPVTKQPASFPCDLQLEGLPSLEGLIQAQNKQQNDAFVFPESPEFGFSDSSAQSFESMMKLEKQQLDQSLSWLSRTSPSVPSSCTEGSVYSSGAESSSSGSSSPLSLPGMVPIATNIFPGLADNMGTDVFQSVSQSVDADLEKTFHTQPSFGFNFAAAPQDGTISPASEASKSSDSDIEHDIVEQRGFVHSRMTMLEQENARLKLALQLKQLEIHQLMYARDQNIEHASEIMAVVAQMFGSDGRNSRGKVQPNPKKRKTCF